MTKPTHADYLTLLRELTQTLSTLTETAQRKTNAVRNDDLAALDACIKTEQAISLSLRSCEQKRLTMLTELGLSETSLGSLVCAYPPQLQSEAKSVVEALQRQYHVYRSTADLARSTLECNLHQIELFLASSDTPSGYPQTRTDPEPPEPLRTDFRA